MSPLKSRKRLMSHPRMLKIATPLLLFSFIFLVTIPFSNLQAQAQQPLNPSFHLTPLNHTVATVDVSCNHILLSPDGNPFPICPGPFPTGGNCTWWGWEQWHLLGYNLPLNWGNAADWIVDATRAGLPVGKTPRVGSLAVFPVADGVWAYGIPGHIAFVTAVSADNANFNVTYQNYGDPTPIYFGQNYNVSVINQSRFQNGSLRFIYFPQTIDPTLFAKLPGINGSNISGIAQANAQTGNNANIAASNRISLGLPPLSTEQEFNADFAGNGLSDLLLYNRQRGRLDVLNLSNTTQATGNHYPGSVDMGNGDGSINVTNNLVNVPFSSTTPDGWGSSLDIHLGNFSGTSESEILLYNRDTGAIDIIDLAADLSVKKHVTLPGWGPGWELYMARLDGQRSSIFMYNRFAHLTSTTSAQTQIPGRVSPNGQNDLSGTPPQGWEKQGRTANILVLDFDKDLNVQHIQQYTLWHNAWEVYVGRFVNPNQDGIFLYDRQAGEARLMDFAVDLTINDYQELHHLTGNWLLYSGDFNGSGRAQMLLYDPSAGKARFLFFASDLSLAGQKSYEGWGQDMILYVGHFGMPTLSVMLYNVQQSQSTFIAFDTSLEIAHRYTLQSWDQNWQILIGAFLDRSHCLASTNCSKGDDILVLNRETGSIQQYVFSFGRQYQVFDNRTQAYLRTGVSTENQLTMVDTTSFNLLKTLVTTIRDEELY